MRLLLLALCCALALPQMAGASDPVISAGGTPSAHSEGFPSEGPAQAFDAQTSTKWCANQQGGPPVAWIQYQLPAAAWLTSYAITSANDSQERDPYSWQMQGSVDGQTWVVVDSRTAEVFSDRFLQREFTVAAENQAGYLYYRLYVTATQQANALIQMAELTLYGLVNVEALGVVAVSATSVEDTSTAPAEYTDAPSIAVAGATSAADALIWSADVWHDVTPAVTVPPYGFGYIVVDPLVPSDLYVGGGGDGVWKSTNYGETWTKINATAGSYTFALAHPNAGQPPILMAGTGGDGHMLRSTNGGATWNETVGGGLAADLYSIQVDPYDATHLISGLHEAPGIAESTNGGTTWQMTAASPAGGTGTSWYPFFIDTGSAATTRTTWIALPQATFGVGTWRTTNGGGAWTKVEDLEHPHGNCQIYQPGGGVVFMTGVYGSAGNGVYRSADLGATWTHVSDSTNGAVVWGSPYGVYSGYAWANVDPVAPELMRAVPPGTSGWLHQTAPSGMTHGPSSVAVTYDGTHYVFVGANWHSGLWRYVEAAPEPVSAEGVGSTTVAEQVTHGESLTASATGSTAVTAATTGGEALEAAATGTASVAEATAGTEQTSATVAGDAVAGEAQSAVEAASAAASGTATATDSVSSGGTAYSESPGADAIGVTAVIDAQSVPGAYVEVLATTGTTATTTADAWDGLEMLPTSSSGSTAASDSLSTAGAHTTEDLYQLLLQLQRDVRRLSRPLP